MTAIITFFTGLIGSVFAAIAARLGAKIAINTIVIGVWVAAAAVFAASITAAGSALVSTMPSFLQDGFSVLPANTGTCIGAIMAGELAAHIYRQVVIIASVKSRV